MVQEILLKCRSKLIVKVHSNKQKRKRRDRILRAVWMTLHIRSERFEHDFQTVLSYLQSSIQLLLIFAYKKSEVDEVPFPCRASQFSRILKGRESCPCKAVVRNCSTRCGCSWSKCKNQANHGKATVGFIQKCQFPFLLRYLVEKQTPVFPVFETMYPCAQKVLDENGSLS